MRSANNVMCPSLRELISSSGSWWVLKGLRVHSKFIVGLPAPMGQSTNGWPWGLAAPDLRGSCLTTSLPPGWPRPSLPLASTFNSLIFDQIIKQTPAFRCTGRMEWGERRRGSLWVLKFDVDAYCDSIHLAADAPICQVPLQVAAFAQHLYLPSSVPVLRVSHFDLELKQPYGTLPELEITLKTVQQIYTHI